MATTSETIARKNDCELHHYFPKVAEESGFAFNSHRPRLRVDWHKIRLIDIENVIRERRFTLIEQHINDILNCVLESEFDVRILDEGVLKMFQLAQLAVEYQQFCRYYLDRSVFVLREEITALAQELEGTKKELRAKDDEIRKLRKKSKYNYKPPMAYGNDNIATMILKTLASKSDIFPSTFNGEGVKYNKCAYCDKIFMNQLYLIGHISRRHANISEIPEKDQDNNQNLTNEKENSKLTNEIAELKEKLKEMENLIKSQSQRYVTAVASDVKTETTHNVLDHSIKFTKDAEVSTSNEDFLLDRIEEWKKEELEKNSKEFNLLRNQIVETIKALKEKEEQKPVQNDLCVIEQLHATIQQQGAEIIGLKSQLSMSKLKTEEEEIQQKKETENHISLWAKRVEVQSKQYEALLQKLNDMTKELQESRVIANEQKDRATHLEGLLQENLANHRAKAHNLNNHEKKPLQKSFSIFDEANSVNKTHQRTNMTKDSKLLQSLHRKAQELLNITVSSSDVSNASAENINIIGENATKQLLHNNKIPNGPENWKKHIKMPLCKKRYDKHETQLISNKDVDDKGYKKKKIEQRAISRSKHSQCMEITGNSGILNHGSPTKIIRAKITEEVNNRLIAAGVDPLKSGLTKNVFLKRRMQLHQKYYNKSKKNTKYQKAKHSILAFLDSNSSFTEENSDKKIVTENLDYVSPSKTARLFNFSSIISNVKNKAKIMVKTNDIKMKRNVLNAEVPKKAMSLLKTSPDTPGNFSPIRNTAEVLTNKSSPNKSVRDNLLLKKVSKRIINHDTSTDESEDISESEQKTNFIYDRKQISLDNLIELPARRPSSANSNMNGPVLKLSVGQNVRIDRTQSESNVAGIKSEPRTTDVIYKLRNDESSATPSKKCLSEDNLQKIPKQTKGVLKNTSSISLNKKKVLFDMDAIQMKSVSASPSQSITDKSNSNEKFEFGLVNLDNEEWEISSIENDMINGTKIQLNTRTAPKIANLKRTIESQLARRNETPPTAPVGGVDVLAGGPTMVKAASIAGSNTSLGSSILDDSDAAPIVNNKVLIKFKEAVQIDDSDLDLSEYSLDGITTTNKKVIT